MNAKNLKNLKNAAEMHRTRDGRLDMDQLSRTMRPKWAMIRMNGAYYDRKGLAEWLLSRGKFSPATRRPLTRAEIADVEDANPHGIYGRAPVLDKNRYV
jgi:hypothetical protein